MTVLIADTGVANLAAVRAALARLGVESAVSRDADQVARAERVVLPGVGSFAAGAAALRAHGLADAVLSRVHRGAPLLAICLGLQLLTEGSEEAPGERGLGVIRARCRRLPRAPRLPHLGWSAVSAASSGPLAAGWAAFAHSFALTEAPPGFAAAHAVHGVPFVAALARGALVACQFHPELSGDYGRELLRAWLEDRAMRRERDAGTDLAPGSARRVIPCLDVRDGRIVKGIRFAGLRDAGDPAERAARYAADGADELVMLDVSASGEGRTAHLDTVRRVRAVLDIPLIVGGGIGEVEQARALLAAGADKVSVNTAAVRSPGLIAALAAEFGSQATLLAVDARRRAGGFEVMTGAGQQPSGRDVVAWAREGERRGAGEILLTSIDRDGTRDGPDLDLLRAVASAVTVPVIASGGIGEAGHAALALDAGADAVLAASIFHDDRESVLQFKRALAACGPRVRS